MGVSFLASLSWVAMTSAIILTHLYSAIAIAVQPRSVKGSGIIRLPITRSPNASLVTKRQSTLPLADFGHGEGYLINISIGSPPQPVTLDLDTGSSDLWVNPSCATSDSPHLCQDLPVYQISSTATDTGKVMDLEYILGKCSGKFYTDDVVLGSQTVKGQQFGVATNSSHFSVGIMGVGLGSESGLTDYYNIIDQLFLQRITASRAFSLDLGNVGTAQGSITFGGFDTMKFTGALSKNAIIPCNLAPDLSPGYWIYLDSVGITLPGLASKNASLTKMPVAVDSGTTISYLPAAVITELLASLTNVTNLGNGSHLVPCSYKNAVLGSVDFTFGRQTINVPFSQFIYYEDEKCYFGAATNEYNISILGDTFLRSTYVVFDQDNLNILMAPAANCGSNIVAIGTGVDAVPSITGACTLSTPNSAAMLTSSSSSYSSKETSFSPSSITTPLTSSSKAAILTSSSHKMRTTPSGSTRPSKSSSDPAFFTDSSSIDTSKTARSG